MGELARGFQRPGRLGEGGKRVEWKSWCDEGGRGDSERKGESRRGGGKETRAWSCIATEIRKWSLEEVVTVIFTGARNG